MNEPKKTYSGEYAYWGPPGTGKTTKLATQANEIVKRTDNRDDSTSPVVICSLTRSAAEEIADPKRGIQIPRWQIGTLHAHAYRMLGSPEIAETHLDEWNERKSNLSLDDDGSKKLDLDDFITVSDWVSSQPSEGAKLSAEYNLLRTKMIPRDQWRFSVLRFADEWESWKKDNGYIDFTDMIELALEECSCAPGDPDVVIVDEAQDHGACELELCKKWGKEAGALMLAGDPWQAIYEWRGADPSFMLKLPENRMKILSKSFRVPLRVRDISMKWMRNYLSVYRDLKYEPRNAEGQIGRVHASYTNPEELIKPILADAENGKEVIVCATCGYMLKPLIAVMRQKGIPFSNPWRRKRGDWNPMQGGKGVSMRDRILAFLRRDENSFPVASDFKGDRARMWNGEELAQWASILPSRVIVRHGAKKFLIQLSKAKKYEQVSEEDLQKVFVDDALLILKSLFNLGDQSRGGQTARLLEWFEAFLMGSKKRVAEYPLSVLKRAGKVGLSKEPKIHIGTIHSFKGSQADSVYVYPDLSPAGEREWQHGRSPERDAVVRCFYVAMTRAKEKLMFCDAATSYAVPF